MKTRALAAVTAGIILGAAVLAGPALAKEAPSSLDTSTLNVETPQTEPAPTEPGAGATPTTPAFEPAGSGTPVQPSSDASTPPIEPTPEPSSTTTSSSPVLTDDTPSASTSGPIVSDDTTEVFWAMPNGGTPENVTWPQTLSGADKMQCGVWYQVDTYPVDSVAALTADGILTDGEDHAVVISWRFVYGGDCPAPPGPADPKATINTTCGLAEVEVESPGEDVLTASVVIYVDGGFNQALAVAAGDHQTARLELPDGGAVEVRTGPAFGDQLLASVDVDKCAVVVPPTDTPTAMPVLATPPVSVVEHVAAVTTTELAETGSTPERVLILGIAAAAFILLALILFAVARGRVHAEHERQQREKHGNNRG